MISVVFIPADCALTNCTEAKGGAKGGKRKAAQENPPNKGPKKPRAPRPPKVASLDKEQQAENDDMASE